MNKNIIVIVFALVAVVFFGAWVSYSISQNYRTVYQTQSSHNTTEQSNTINQSESSNASTTNSDKDLTAVSDSLDTIDIDEIDNELNQNDTDANAF